MRWALAMRDPADWLARDDPALIATNDGMFKHHLDRYKYPDRHGSDPSSHRDLGLAYLQELEAQSRRVGLSVADRVNLSAYLIRLGSKEQQAIEVLTPVTNAQDGNFMVFANLASAYELTGQRERGLPTIEDLLVESHGQHPFPQLPVSICSVTCLILKRDAMVWPVSSRNASPGGPEGITRCAVMAVPVVLMAQMCRSCTSVTPGSASR